MLGGMCMIKIAFSRPVWVHGSRVEWNTTDCDNRLGYTKTFIVLKVTPTCNIHNHTPNYSISLLAYYSSLPPSLFTDHVDERISTEDSAYGSSGWHIWYATMAWRQLRIIGKWFTNCHCQRQSIWETSPVISSAAWVWLPAFTAAISRCYAVSSVLSIQHDTHFATNHQHKPRISKLWAKVARIWPPPRCLWWVSNDPPFVDFTTRAVISSSTESASRTSGKPSSQLATMFEPWSSNLTAFRGTKKTPGQPPNETIPAAHRATGNRWTMIPELPPLPDMSKGNYYANDGIKDSSNLGGAEGKMPVSLEQMEFSLKQFAKRMGQANISAFNKW